MQRQTPLIKTENEVVSNQTLDGAAFTPDYSSFLSLEPHLGYFPKKMEAANIISKERAILILLEEAGESFLKLLADPNNSQALEILMGVKLDEVESLIPEGLNYVKVIVNPVKYDSWYQGVIDLLRQEKAKKRANESAEVKRMLDVFLKEKELTATERGETQTQSWTNHFQPKSEPIPDLEPLLSISDEDLVFLASASDKFTP